MAREVQPWCFHWRASPSFILATAAVGLFTDLVLYGIEIPILPFLFRDRFQAPKENVQAYTSGLLAIYSGSSVLFSVPAGWMASKFGARRIFLISLMVLLMSSAMFAFARNLIMLAASSVLQGLSTAVVWTAGLGMVHDAVPRDNIGQAIGTIFASVSVGELVGPVIGGMVYDWRGMKGIFGISAALLTFDFAMRLLVVDGKVAMQYETDRSIENDYNTIVDDTGPLLPAVSQSNDSSHGRSGSQDNRYRIPCEVSGILKAIPVLHCFREARFHMAMHLSFAQAVLIGTLDATVPIEAASLFGFSSREVGFMFVALMLPYLTLGRFFGQAVDKYGTRSVATISYLYLIPWLLLLGLPRWHVAEGKYDIVLFCFVLAMNGIGLAAVSSSTFVEAIEIVGKYEAASPDIFGDNGPYSQLFGFNSLYFFAGLAVGPVVGGALREHFGYGLTGVALGLFSFVTAIMSFFILAPERHGRLLADRLFESR